MDLDEQIVFFARINSLETEKRALETENRALKREIARLLELKNQVIKRKGDEWYV